MINVGLGDGEDGSRKGKAARINPEVLYLTRQSEQQSVIQILRRKSARVEDSEDGETKTW
jgi:hypothetical protein